MRTYHWSIALRHIRHHKASALFIACNIALATFILSMAGGWFLELRTTMQQRAENLQLVVFMKETADTHAANELAVDLARYATLASVTVQSQDSVRALFNERYSVDVSEVLPTNPFPVVMRVRFQADRLTTDGFWAVVQRCRSSNDVVESVSYDSATVKSVLGEMRTLSWIMIAGAAFVLVLCLIIIVATLRAERMYSREEAETAYLLGARPAFLRRSMSWRNILCCCVGIFVGVAGSHFLAQSFDASLSSALVSRELMIIPASVALLLVITMITNLRLAAYR